MTKKLILPILILTTTLASCDVKETPKAQDVEELTQLTFMLDWVPNTNHTGIFVAEAKEFFTEAGLDVDIIQPGEVYAEQAVISGVADLGSVSRNKSHLLGWMI